MAMPRSAKLIAGRLRSTHHFIKSNRDSYCVQDVAGACGPKSACYAILLVRSKTDAV
jgi:hypothetical protein